MPYDFTAFIELKESKQANKEKQLCSDLKYEFRVKWTLS